MSYQELRGNLFNSQAKALVNTVNCVGVMGKGIALEFRRRYPEMFALYASDCQAGKLKPGRIYPYPSGEILILNFAVKDHWRYPSRVDWIKSCLEQFVAEYQSLAIASIAFPWMGAQNGGIPIGTIKALMRQYLKDLNAIDIEVYDFDLFASDPLYEKLMEVMHAADPIATLKPAGIKEEGCQKIVAAYSSGRAKSLAHLAENKVVSGQTIDKLYLFLRDWSPQRKNPSDVTQLSLF